MVVKYKLNTQGVAHLEGSGQGTRRSSSQADVKIDKGSGVFV
jgi:hypothetical protein